LSKGEGASSNGPATAVEKGGRIAKKGEGGLNLKSGIGNKKCDGKIKKEQSTLI